MITQADLDRINQTLKDKGVWHESGLTTESIVAITIEWGDWKHDHDYVDYLMGELGYEKLGERETETDGSDCYSSIHFYAKK